MFLLDSFFCESCDKNYIDEDNTWPDAKTFQRWLPSFLIDNPCEDCPKGGHAAYGQVLELLLPATKDFLKTIIIFFCGRD